MRLYLEYILSIGRSPRIMSRHRPASGFTVIELLLASLMMLIAVSIAGNGVINLLKSNYKANADSELRNSLNRTLEFMGDEVKRASLVADSPSKITSTFIPSGATPILAFQVPKPSDPSSYISEQVVYYVQDRVNPWLGPQVLWRRGPAFDENGNYKNPEDTGGWITTPMTDMVVGSSNNEARRDCDPYRQGTLSGWQRFPEKDSDVQGIYSCVRKDGGRQVALVANAELKLTTSDSDSSAYSISTKVSTRASNASFYLATSSGSTYNSGPPSSGVDESPFGTTPNLIIPTQPVTVETKPVQLPSDTTCSSSCYVYIYDPNNITDRTTQDFTSGSAATIDAKTGTNIILYVEGYSSGLGTTNRQAVNLYTSDSTLPSTLPNITLTKNQVLIELTRYATSTKPSRTYVVLVNITPKG